MIAPPRLDTHRFRAFGGATCEVLAVGCDLDEVSAAVAEVYAFEARLTRFDERSELSEFNAAAGGTVAVSPLLEALLRAALDAHALTGGLVNAAVLRAVAAAGYDVSIERVRARKANASTSASPAADAAPLPPLPALLEVYAGSARLAPGWCVDLGGVAKGWLADRLCERLGDAAVNLGGDLRAIGGGPDGAGWTVALCDGSNIAVRDAGVATSGTTSRRWAGGHHLIDPRTGRCAQTGLAAVTVVAATAFDAECLAKGALLAGDAGARTWAWARGAMRLATLLPSENGR
jgi:thiamine biosynthesis lipoprotein